MASKIYESLHHIFKDLDLNKVHDFNYWIYVFSGFTRYESSRRWKKKFYMIYKNTVKTVYAVSVTFFVIDAILVRNDFDKLSFNLSSSVLVATKVSQFIHMSKWRDIFEDLFDKLGKNLQVETVGKSEEDRIILKNKSKVVARLTSIFYFLLVFGFPMRIMTDTALGTRGYLIPVPFREFYDSYYEIVYAQQVIICFHFFFTTLAYDLLGFSLFARLIAHYEILEVNLFKIKSLYPKRNFQKYVRGYSENIDAGVNDNVLIQKTNYPDKIQNFLKNNKKVKRNLMRWTDGEEFREQKTFQLLKESLIHHQKLLAEGGGESIVIDYAQFLTVFVISIFKEGGALSILIIAVRTFSDFFSRPLLIQLIGMTILVGIATLQILIFSKGLNLMLMQQLLYISTMLTNIVCLCSFGSEISSRSISAMNALYDAPWYDMSINNRNMVNLMLEKLVRGPVIKGGGMINIDRVTCVKFLQSSYNMVNLLRNKM